MFLQIRSSGSAHEKTHLERRPGTQSEGAASPDGKKRDEEEGWGRKGRIFFVLFLSATIGRRADGGQGAEQGEEFFKREP